MGGVGSSSHQFRPNNELKNHLLNLSNNNAKTLQASVAAAASIGGSAAAGMRSQHNSKDRLK